MHGGPLNIAKILFKYSYLEVMTEPEQREELAEYMISIGCPFDCRLDSANGWMRASAFNAFENGSRRGRAQGSAPTSWRSATWRTVPMPPSRRPPAPRPRPRPRRRRRRLQRRLLHLAARHQRATRQSLLG